MKSTLGLGPAMRALILLTAFAACSPGADTGEAIVFSSGRSGDGDLYMLLPGDSTPHLLVGTPAGEGALRFDPLGERVIHSRFDSTGATLFDGATPLFRDPNGDVAPAWSSSGLIAYVREVDGVADLFTAERDGGNEVRRTSDEAVERYPSWDPWGEGIVYAKRLESGWDLHILDLATGVERRLTEDGVYVGHPAWSPSGGMIAFDRMYDGQTDIAVYRLDERTITRITETEGNELIPAWSSDGARITYAGEANGNWDVWEHDLGEGVTWRRTSDPAFDGGPIFVPAGVVRQESAGAR